MCCSVGYRKRFLEPTCIVKQAFTPFNKKFQSRVKRNPTRLLYKHVLYMWYIDILVLYTTMWLNSIISCLWLLQICRWNIIWRRKVLHKILNLSWTKSLQRFCFFLLTYRWQKSVSFVFHYNSILCLNTF